MVETTGEFSGSMFRLRGKVMCEFLQQIPVNDHEVQNAHECPPLQKHQKQSKHLRALDTFDGLRVQGGPPHNCLRIPRAHKPLEDQALGQD